jgi:hypothetical protein
MADGPLLCVLLERCQDNVGKALFDLFVCTPPVCQSMWPTSHSVRGAAG